MTDGTTYGEIERLEAELAGYIIELKKEQSKNRVLKLKNAKLREALEYYADPEHYEEYIAPMAGPIGIGVLVDGGRKAKKALEGDGNE